MGTQCAVCKRTYAVEEQAEHLRNNHLGPHNFWFNAKKYKVTVPSMQVGELVKLADASPLYHVFRESDDDTPDVAFSHSECVDLTNEPRFYTVPPATMWG